MLTPERRHVVDRVRQILNELGDYGHLDVRSYGHHIVIGPPDDLFARLTPVGDDAFGLSFRAPEGGWEPMLLIDTLDEIVHDMTAAIGVAAA